MIDASVVICAYTLDRWDDLLAAVGSVLNQTRPAREIFVVVDGNEELLLRAQSEIGDATVVPNTKVPGLSGGRMTGAELATGSVIVFLDDDAFADEDWLAELLAPYENPNVLGVGGHIVPLWRHPKPSWFPAEFNWIVGCTWAGMSVGPNGEVRNMTGANMSVRADVMRRSGGFTGELGRLGSDSLRTCDDTEFCIRVGRLYPGGVWLYSPTATVHHCVPAQRTTWQYFVYRCRMEGTSKAVLSGLTGSADGLRAERRFLFTLGQAVLRDIFAGKIRRALAICAGLAITTATYAQTRLTRKGEHHNAESVAIRG